jgi:DNA-binding CsgD family transcriptional regulator
MSLIPSWLMSEDYNEDMRSSKFLKEQITKMTYLLFQKRYDEILSFKIYDDDSNTENILLFGYITIKALKAVAAMRTGNAESAVRFLEIAYNSSFDGELQMMFVLLGRYMRDLIAIALKSECNIPSSWLKSVSAKATAYAKKAAAISALYRRDHDIEDNINLTERERQVLNDLFHGLSRQEIAETQFISVNTVKTVIQTLYVKLGAVSNVDAVRIALEHKLLNVP